MEMSKTKQCYLLSYISTASISAAIITPALPNIQSHFLIDKSQLNQVVSLFLLGYVFGQLLYGPIASRFGNLKAIRIGFIINIIGIFLSITAAQIEEFQLFLLARLLTALGAASGLCCTFSLMSSLLNESQYKSISAYIVLSFTLASGGSVFIGGQLTSYLSWIYCLWFLAAYSLVQLITTFLFTEKKCPSKPINMARIAKNYLGLFVNLRFVGFSFILGLVSIITYGYSVAAPLYAMQTLHLNSASYGSWSLLNMLGMFGSSFLAAYLITRFDYKNTLFIGLALIIPLILAFLFNSSGHSHSIMAFFMASLLLFLFSGIIFPCASYFAMCHTEDKANGASIMSFINMGSATLAVLLMGVLPFSLLHSFLLILTLSLTGAFFLLGQYYFLGSNNNA